MEIKRKYLCLTILLLGPLAFSCKKQNSDLAADRADGAENGGNTKAILPLQMGSGTAKLSFSYGEGQQLSKVEYADGKSVVLFLNAKKQPERLEVYNGTKTVGTTDYTLNGDGLVIDAEQYAFLQSRFTYTGHFTIDYNSKQQPLSIKNYDATGKLIDERTRTYDTAGNLLSEENSAGQNSYSSDQKNGIFSNVKNSSLFAFETGETLFMSVSNNITACSNTSNSKLTKSYTYSYDANGFPKTINTKQDGKTSSMAVTYK